MTRMNCSIDVWAKLAREDGTRGSVRLLQDALEFVGP
jgi:hypothetical protein